MRVKDNFEMPRGRPVKLKYPDDIAQQTIESKVTRENSILVKAEKRKRKNEGRILHLEDRKPCNHENKKSKVTPTNSDETRKKRSTDKHRLTKERFDVNKECEASLTASGSNLHQHDWTHQDLVDMEILANDAALELQSSGNPSVPAVDRSVTSIEDRHLVGMFY